MDNGTLDFVANISDVLSGVDNSKTKKYLNGDTFNENILKLPLIHLGTYAYRIEAEDKAGNRAVEEVNFEIDTNLEAIQKNINFYADAGMFKKKFMRKYISVRLKHLENLFKLLDKTESSKLKPKPKQAAIDALKKIINADIDQLIRKIGRKTPRWFDQNVANLLTESLEYLRIK
jgi:hypothetical protein